MEKEAVKSSQVKSSMTTLAMIFGMVPVALGLGAGSEFRVGMAVTVIGGLRRLWMSRLI